MNIIFKWRQDQDLSFRTAYQDLVKEQIQNEPFIDGKYFVDGSSRVTLDNIEELKNQGFDVIVL
jgi:hypothetical protein